MTWVQTSKLWCVFCLWVLGIPAFAFGQSNLFDSTELSEKSSGIAIEAGTNLVLGMKTSAYRKGEATRIGLNFMPREFTEITYCSGKLLARIEDTADLAQLAQRWIAFKESVGIDVDNCKSFVRGTRAGAIGSRRFGTPPSIMVVMATAPFDTSKLKAKAAKSDELEYFISTNGAAIGFPSPDVMVYGTKNEVLNALLLKNGGNARQPGFEWIDYSKYDSLKLSRERNFVTHTAYFTKDGVTSGRLMLHRNSGVAKYEKEILEIQAEFFKSDDPAKFLASREAEMQRKGYLVPILTDKQRTQLVQSVKSAKKHRNPHLKTTISQEGPILVVSQNWDKDHAYQATGRPALDELLPSFKRLEKERDIFFSASSAAKFERYEFDRRDGTSTEQGFVRGFGFGHIRSVKYDRYNNLPTPEGQMAQLVLNNTSSRVLRNHIIQKLSESATAQALMILGIESHRFDLSSSKNVLDPKEDDRPQLLGEPSISHEGTYAFKDLEEALTYFLSNPGDPILLIAVCKIAGDLKLSKLTSKLQSVAKSTSNERVKAAANDALSSIADSTLISKNILAPPADADTALRWIKGTDRAQKAASLVWVMRNPDLGELHSGVVSALIYLLDDGNYFNETLIVLKKICKPSDAPLFHQVIKLALDSRSKFKMRQEYSLLRVVEMVLHLKDKEGIKLAYSVGDYDLAEFMKLYSEKSDAQTKALMEEALDQCVQEYVANPTRESTSRMISYSFTDAQKSVLRKFARDAWEAQSEVLEFSRFWDVVELTSPYQAEDVPLLVGLIFDEAGSHTKIIDFLIAHKTGVEDWVIAQLDAGKKTWQDRETIRLLEAIGTAKSAPYLEQLKNKK